MAAIPTGTISIFGGNNSQIPSGWLACDGAQYTVASYQALATVLGATGDSFNVPDFATTLPCASNGTNTNLVSADSCSFTQQVDMAGANFNSQNTSSTGAYSNVDGSSNGNHEHSVETTFPFIPRANVGSGGWWHTGNGSNISHGADGQFGGDTGYEGQARHSHRVNQTSRASHSHEHGVNMAGSQSHSHPVLTSNEVATVSAGSGTVTMPPRKFTVYMIKT